MGRRGDGLPRITGEPDRWRGSHRDGEEVVMSMLQAALEPSTLVVAIDPGKVMNRVWVSDGEGL